MNNCQLSLFSEKELAKMISPAFAKKKNHIEWDLRKSRLGAVRADLSKNLILSEEGCPIIKPFFGVPDYPLIDFKEALSSKDYLYWVHFFIDDVNFEQIWHPQYTERDIEILIKYKGIFTPDFTLDPRLGPWQEQFNIFRSRTIGQLVQKCGGTAIPTVGWSFLVSVVCLKVVPLLLVQMESLESLFRFECFTKVCLNLKDNYVLMLYLSMAKK